MNNLERKQAPTPMIFKTGLSGSQAMTWSYGIGACITVGMFCFVEAITQRQLPPTASRLQELALCAVALGTAIFIVIYMVNEIVWGAVRTIWQKQEETLAALKNEESA
jgi:hypothetical protein